MKKRKRKKTDPSRISNSPMAGDTDWGQDASRHLARQYSGVVGRDAGALDKPLYSAKLDRFQAWVGVILLTLCVLTVCAVAVISAFAGYADTQVLLGLLSFATACGMASKRRERKPSAEPGGMGTAPAEATPRR